MVLPNAERLVSSEVVDPLVLRIAALEEAIANLSEQVAEIKLLVHTPANIENAALPQQVADLVLAAIAGQAIEGLHSAKTAKAAKGH